MQASDVALMVKLAASKYTLLRLRQMLGPYPASGHHLLGALALLQHCRLRQRYPQ